MRFMQRTSHSWLAVGLVLIVAGAYTGLRGLSGHGFGGDSLGCELVELDAKGDVVPVQAVCDWEISPARLHALLAEFGSHDDYFGGLAESTVLPSDDGVTRVRQVHTASGISDRAAVVDWTVTEIEGGRRYSWTKAGDQSGIDGRGLEAIECAGSWDVLARGDDVRVVYEMRYAPGGNVPFFLMRWFQGAGIRGVLADFRDYAELDLVAAR
jgi:hypothetical protein